MKLGNQLISLRCNVFTLSFDLGNVAAVSVYFAELHSVSTGKDLVFPVLDETLYTIRGGSSHVSDSCGFAAKIYPCSVQLSCYTVSPKEGI